MSMSGRLADVAANALLLAVAAGACVGSWRLEVGDVHNPGPGFMPLAAAALLGLMALVQLVRLAARSPRGGASPAPFARSRWAVVAVVLGTIAAFGAVIGPLGFALSTVLLLFVLFAVVARKRWWVALAAALAVATAASLLFRALGLSLPQGPLGL